MKISIDILNPERESKIPNATDRVNSEATWYSRTKTYESDCLDDDMKRCTISHYVDRVTIDNAQLTTKSSVQDLIDFLTNAKVSFKN